MTGLTLYITGVYTSANIYGCFTAASGNGQEATRTEAMRTNGHETEANKTNAKGTEANVSKTN